MTTKISALIAVLGLLASGHANAVPCGVYSTYGGVSQATACQNAPSGDASDTVADLNDGNYFGHNDWQLLNRTGDQSEGSAGYWTVSPSGLSATSGTFQLASGIWDDFSDLLVVLKDGGSFHDRDVKWSAYLLPADFLGTYDWSYDGGHKKIGHTTLYGRVVERVSEPASLALVLTGLACLSVLMYRRGRAPRA